MVASEEVVFPEEAQEEVGKLKKIKTEQITARLKNEKPTKSLNVVGFVTFAFSCRKEGSKSVN